MVAVVDSEVLGAMRLHVQHLFFIAAFNLDIFCNVLSRLSFYHVLCC